MTVYYVNSVLGSDRNAGTNENAAFASLAKVEALKLKPGDSVLLAAGSTFKEQFDVKWSGKPGAPITIGSYGSGPAPVITGPGDGIHGSKANNIVVENIAIKNTAGNAIYAGSASNWTIRNIEISATGSPAKSGSLAFQSSKNITVENSVIKDVNSDGIWMRHVDGVKLLKNTITNARGPNADAVQINDSSNIVISGNKLDQSNTVSHKGVLVLINAKNALVESNSVVGGGFGIAAHAGNGIYIRDNDISGYKGYSWSYGIGLGDQGNARNYDIAGNYIHNGVNGVLISSAGSASYVRENINIHSNLFDTMSKAAFSIDRVASGSFTSNIISDNSTPVYVSSRLGTLATFVIGENKQLAQAHQYTHAEAYMSAYAVKAGLSANADIVTIQSADKLHYTGNILSNDFHGNNSLLLQRVDNKALTGGGVDIAGKYGMLHVNPDGSYDYALDLTKVAGLHGTVSESHIYKVTDGRHFDADQILIKIDADHVNLSAQALFH